MGRLRRLTVQQLVALLESNGFVRVRQKGSHAIFQRGTPTGTVTVPVPTHRGDMPLGTLRSIAVKSRLPRELFEEDSD